MPKTIFYYVDEHNRTKIFHSTEDVMCDKVIQQFVYFLRAVSFHDNTIKQGLESVLEDTYREENAEDME